MSEQRCGTCRWSTESLVAGFLTCNFTMPASVGVWDAMKESEGTDCPCYERKDRNEVREATTEDISQSALRTDA